MIHIHLSTVGRLSSTFPKHLQQRARHSHPRFTPDRAASPAHSFGSACYAKSRGGGGKAVLYTSDLTAYSDMYLVEVGDFDDFPDLK